MSKPLSLWPLGGFLNSVRRQDVPITHLTGPSKDWLVARGKLRRRAGSAVVGTVAAGHLESAWDAKARRMVSAALSSLADHYPTWLALFTNETTKAAQIAFRSTNGTDATRVIGQEHGAFHYPATGVPTLRCIPYVYENEHGGLTLARLVNEKQRRYLCGGSRDLLRQGNDIAWPGRTSAPGRWNGQYNDSDSAGTEECEVSPLGMIPPLQMPTAARGALVSGDVAAFKGSDAFFYSVLFENEAGEYSTYPIPLAPNSVWHDHPGFGYIQVNPDSESAYYDSVVFSDIPVGPPGTLRRHLVRSAKVNVTSTTSYVFPAAGALYFCATINNNTQTTYTLTEGNDLSLDASPITSELIKRKWPPRARCAGRFDGHFLLGDLDENPYALILAPWSNGGLNAPIDDVRLYGSTAYYVAVTPTQLVIRSVTAGVATDRAIDLAGRTLKKVAEYVSTNQTESDLGTVTGCSYDATAKVIYTTEAIAALYPGAIVTGTGIPDGTTVLALVDDVVNAIWIDHFPTQTVASGSVSFTGVELAATNPYPWGAGMVDGADRFEQSTELLRTRVSAGITFAADSKTGTLTTATDAAHITPGMLAYLEGGFAEPTEVTAVDTDAGTVTVDTLPLRAVSALLETVVFAYDTGDDITLSGTVQHGYVRAFGNAFPVVLPWRKAYLDKFNAAPQSLEMSGASPGHAQNALNSWYQGNRHTGPADFGALMGFADLGPYALVFFAKGRMRLWNPRTGTTRADSDYTLTTVSWTRGARSPYAICSGNGWAIFLADEGLFACGAGEGEVLLSRDIYDAGAPVGQRGELEYAVAACIAASESGSDGYKLSAQVHNGVLSVRYAYSASESREIRYDFSAGVGRSGLAEITQDGGSTPYPWSAPLTLPVEVSCWVAESDGLHHYAARNDNVGTADGRVDEIDTGTSDDGAVVAPIGYTGLAWPAGLDDYQPTEVRTVAVKAGTGLSVAVTRDPELAPESAQWDDLPIPTSAAADYVRAVRELPASARGKREAVAVRVMDDGSGPCPEVSLVLVNADVLPTAGK